jgi:DNA mismatch repair ATPase MutS
MSPEQILATYQALKEKYKTTFESLSKQHRTLSLLRLLVVIAAVTLYYLFATTKTDWELYVAVALTLVFIVLMKKHQSIAKQRTYIKALEDVNTHEIDYLTGSKIAFHTGAEYHNDQHAYSADLDLFGNRSLYHQLNRTATQMGQLRFAKSLVKASSNETILHRQRAVEALVPDLEGRQHFFALGSMANDNRDIYNRLIKWSEEEERPVEKPLVLLAYALPIALILATAMYAFTQQDIYWSVINKLVPVNLLLFFGQYKHIRKAMFSTEKINEMLRSYGTMLQSIESADYKDPYLRDIQEKITDTDANASKALQELGAVFSKMESIQNPFSAFIMNGLFLYHIHQLNHLNNWKRKYRKHIGQWLELIGEMELLQSLANLKYNNPDFCFPVINTNHEISFRSLGHPLIKQDKRVCNDVSFNQERFIILTGSNMSGKSTFLRTLGVNMVLAGMGAPICAAAADLHPMKLFVSMRQSDSLADSESYFFAEVKRLKYIMDELKDEVCFVLLDEILRGTNSDDKRSGTIGVIEKMITRKTIGAIATHDLEVCHTTELHPGTLVNKCFEVEIINDELVFDYTLRTGICKNKSATFLMKKMGII